MPGHKEAVPAFGRFRGDAVLNSGLDNQDGFIMELDAVVSPVLVLEWDVELVAIVCRHAFGNYAGV